MGMGEKRTVYPTALSNLEKKWDTNVINKQVGWVEEKLRMPTNGQRLGDSRSATMEIKCVAQARRLVRTVHWQIFAPKKGMVWSQPNKGWGVWVCAQQSALGPHSKACDCLLSFPRYGLGLYARSRFVEL